MSTLLYQALATNVSVKALDLSHNMIGDKETYNFVRPDYTTGGEAIAEMLEVTSFLTYSRCSMILPPSLLEHPPWKTTSQ